MVSSPQMQLERPCRVVRVWTHGNPRPHPQTLDLFIRTSNQLEGTAENIQGAHEQVEEPQKQDELPDPSEDA